MKFLARAATLAAALCLAQAAFAAEKHVAVVTPYLSAVATNDMVQTFKGEGTKHGWSVNVVDTHGDMNQFANRLQDFVSAKVDAIVLVSVDPGQAKDQVAAAHAAGIPVISMDGAKGEGVTLNVTSDNGALGRALSEFIIGELHGKGNIVKFFHSAHPGVHQRELALDAALAKNPDIKVIADYYVQVPGQIDNSRKAMEDMIRAHRGQFQAVWAAWDEPAIGAVLALQAENAEKGVIVAGIDGNPQAIDMIKKCSALVATVKQDFAGIAQASAAALDGVFAGKPPAEPEVRIPGVLVTRQSLGVTCG